MQNDAIVTQYIIINTETVICEVLGTCAWWMSSDVTCIALGKYHKH